MAPDRNSLPEAAAKVEGSADSTRHAQVTLAAPGWDVREIYVNGFRLTADKGYRAVQAGILLAAGLLKPGPTG